MKAEAVTLPNVVAGTRTGNDLVLISYFRSARISMTEKRISLP